MNSLLSRWGCQVWTARSREECATLLDSEMRPQLALIDYHLDDGETGTQIDGLAAQAPGRAGGRLVISADTQPELVAEIHAAGLGLFAASSRPRLRPCSPPSGACAERASVTAGSATRICCAFAVDFREHPHLAGYQRCQRRPSR